MANGDAMNFRTIDLLTDPGFETEIGTSGVATGWNVAYSGSYSDEVVDVAATGKRSGNACQSAYYVCCG